MTRFFRTMRIKPFKSGAAFEYFRRIAEYINSTYPEASFQVYTNILGHEYATAYQMIDVEDYSAWRRFVAASSKDQELLAMRRENEPDFIVEGSVVDTMMETI
jgi:hypothetical protein